MHQAGLTGLRHLVCCCLVLLFAQTYRAAAQGDEVVYLSLTDNCLPSRHSPGASYVDYFLIASAGEEPRKGGGATGSFASFLALESAPQLRRVPIFPDARQAAAACQSLRQRGYDQGLVGASQPVWQTLEQVRGRTIVSPEELAAILREKPERYRLVGVEPAMRGVLPASFQIIDPPFNVVDIENDVILTYEFMVKNAQLASQFNESSVILRGNYLALYQALISTGGDKGAAPLVCR